MAGIMTWRRCALATAAACATLALAACAANEPPPAGGGDSQLGGAPTSSATPAPTTGTAGAPSPTKGSSAPFYPKDARTYAQELFKAWAGPNYTRLNQLAIQSAVQQIRDSVNSGGQPNSQWTYISCGPGEATGFTTCLFRNAHGDESTITMDKAQLGFPTAVTEAPLIRTQYSDDPGSYAAYFINAWQEGNRQRMARLSSSAIATYFIGQGGALSAWGQDTPVDIGGGQVTVQFSGLSGDAGRYYTLKVLANPDGKANAIKGYCTGFDCSP